VNLEEYETKGFSTYTAFAETVRFILERALAAAPDVPRPQSIQCRAKSVESLRRRLDEAGKSDTESLELDRRDLAGVRLIFYTNNEVDRFLASTLIKENFDIEEESTRVHHPTPENLEAKYRAIHYTVRLRDERTRLPEYAKFKGLRCEVQIQTILNHAWSETSHDILYKHTLAAGYGTKAMQGIARRFETIMDKYLVPAGYEFQKAQQDFERVLKGKELFDKDIVKSLESAANNNERYEVLLALKDYALPHYDDLRTAYDEVKQPLLGAVRTSRGSKVVPIETVFGIMEGIKPETVTKLVVEIIERLRYVDIPGTLQLLIDIYRDEESDRIRRQILEAAKRLAEYNIDAYGQAGPLIQMSLVDHLAAMGNDEVDRIRPIAIAIWTESLQSDITGSKWKADSLEIRTGALPVSDQLREVRDKAIRALFAAYDRSNDDQQRSAILTALNAATRTPIRGGYSNELLASTIRDATRIVEFLTERATSMSYELRQHIEHQLLHEYRQAKSLSNDPDNRFGCQLEAEGLLTAIFRFRDTINVDSRFGRYKVLVGFESVYPEHWTNDEYNYAEAEIYRSGQVDRYLEEINEQNENEWFELITRCAETKSSDLATFPVFGTFIAKLAETKPEVADRFLGKASASLRNFLPGFLSGLALSGRSDIYLRTLERELDSATNLGGVARHLRQSQVTSPEFAVRLLSKAIAERDSIAVIECLVFALESYGTDKLPDGSQFIQDALTYLNDRKDTRWIGAAWFLEKAAKFYAEMKPEGAALLLQNLSYVSKVGIEVERVLTRIAERYPGAVWDYFGARLATEPTEHKDEESFEGVPFRFFGLEKEFSKNPELAIEKGLSWFTRDRTLFQFRGGRVLSSAFPNCTPEFALALADLVRRGGDTEGDFALAILKNYTGQVSIHPVLKEILSRFPSDGSKSSQVRSSLDSTGVVSGELGFAEAWRARRDSLKEWLTDERPPVKAFAEAYIAALDLRISAEHRRAEAEKEMWKRQFDDDEDGDDQEG
jgi:ppGpp synthetase/RelA/SpoT-type nucleotidyltranferase